MGSIAAVASTATSRSPDWSTGVAGMSRETLSTTDVASVRSANMNMPHRMRNASTMFTNGPAAITTRHKIIDRVIADNIRISGSHFPFPGTGVFVKDGNAYGFSPVQI